MSYQARIRVPPLQVTGMTGSDAEDEAQRGGGGQAEFGNGVDEVAAAEAAAR